MNPENDAFEQLELFAVSPDDDVLVVSVDDGLSERDAYNLKQTLDKLLPEGCHSIVLNRVTNMTFIPSRMRLVPDIPTE